MATLDRVSAIKARVRERDGFACVICGMSNSDHIAATGRSLDVHRVTPGSEYSVDPGVCITLCRGCHGPQPKSPPARPRRPPRPTRMVRIPEVFAVALKQLAREECSDITEQVRAAIREYLERRERLPSPGAGETG